MTVNACGRAHCLSRRGRLCQVNMMSKMRHPNVVLLMGIASKQPHLAIVTEYCARGSLYRLLHHTEIALDIRRRVKMAIDIAKGMTYLHSATPVRVAICRPNCIWNASSHLTLLSLATVLGCRLSYIAILSRPIFWWTNLSPSKSATSDWRG